MRDHRRLKDGQRQKRPYPQTNSGVRPMYDRLIMVVMHAVTLVRAVVVAMLAVALAAFSVGCSGADGFDAEGSGNDAEAAVADGMRVRTLARGLEVPWDIAFLPDRRALVTERPGRVRLLDARGRLRRSPVARVTTQARGEGGLLGIAVDPAFSDGRRFVYLYVTTARGMQVQRWRMSGERLRRDAVVLGGIRAGSIHNSGRLRFGPDGNLYVSTGDAGQRELAQRRDSLNGKILRLSPSQYRTRTRKPTIYAIGHRNPQGLAWQPGTGRLFTTDHGPSGFDGPSGDDEVNVIRRGRNYGWPRVRGRRHRNFTPPAFVWEKTIAPSGATFITRGAWRGDLLVAALRGRSLRRLQVNGTRIVRGRQPGPSAPAACSSGDGSG